MFAEKNAKATHIFSAKKKISVNAINNDQSFNDTLTKNNWAQSYNTTTSRTTVGPKNIYCQESTL